MPIEIKINNSLNANARYITYAPSPCQIRQTPWRQCSDGRN